MRKNIALWVMLGASMIVSALTFLLIGRYKTISFPYSFYFAIFTPRKQ